MTHPLEITALGELEIVMKRTFDAPRAVVFEAWTSPELLPRWLGAHGGWSMSVCEIDLRAGGRYRYVWRHADGSEMGLAGVFQKVIVPERIVCTERFDEPWYPGEALVTNVLEEVGETTVCTLTLHYESKEARDQVLASPMEGGVAAGFEQLDSLLPTLG